MPYSDPVRQREYQRQRMAATRAEYLAGRVCIDCGDRDDLELDHIDPDAKAEHRVWSWSPLRRERELAKCVVRCRPCHSARHHPAQHGTRGRYQKGCRCEPCKAAKAEANQREYERRRRESNAREGLCRPSPSHSATAPEAERTEPATLFEDAA